MTGRALLAAVIAMAGCYGTHDLDAESCKITCDGECPGDLTCTAGLCVAAGQTCSVVATPDFAHVEVGARSVCALTVGSAVYCWGDNDVGQVGTGASVLAATSPQRVGDPGAVWTALAVGGQHACGVHDGQLACWGNDAFGAVSGLATATPAYTPESVKFVGAAPTSFDAVAAGSRTSCALSGGHVWCWGPSDQVGYATSGGATELDTSALGGVTFTAIAAGAQHACGLTTTGGIVCWGHNDHGEIDASAPPTSGVAAVTLPAGTVAIAVAPGDSRTCAILAPAATPTASSGQLWCWGRNDDGLIDVAAELTVPPTQIGTRAAWSAVAGNQTQICGVLDGTGLCWGGSTVGAMGVGAWIFSAPPTMPGNVGSADAIALSKSALFGESHANACGLSGHRLACWGDNRGGELANGTLTEPGTPTTIAPPTGARWTAIWSGDYHTCAADDANGLWCWGADDRGQVSGQPCASGACVVAAPMRAPVALTTIGDVVLGDAYSCVRDGTSGQTTCWGDPTRTTASGAAPSVQAVGTAGTYRALSGGATATCGTAAADGTTVCWGNIDLGPRFQQPTQQTQLAGLGALTFGTQSECGLDATGHRWCGGFNYQGQVGNGSDGTDYVAPALSTDPITYTAISLRHDHACAIGSDLGLWCWGTNYSGESGDTSGADTTLTPIPVTSAGVALTGCTRVAVNSFSTCAICDHQPVCVGFDGNGYYGEAPSGVQVYVTDARPLGLPGDTAWTQIAHGESRVCALGQTGTLVCTGTGTRGELGDGSHGAPAPSPIALPSP